MADPKVSLPKSKRRYVCAICNKPVRPEEAVYSTLTRQRFHPTCIWRRKT
ncbi:MAG: hypothetical protein NUW01_09065 [Gemmatimonadaceae bacterium]|nr:hypothetical protein [Gemmatimonadaceae bacterium]